MTHRKVDFAVLGATPLARLVAGLLAGTHGKTVAFSGESQSGYRLPRGLDVSAFALTRPETWALLRRTTPETLKLVSRIGGRRSFRRLDPIIFADGPAGREALSHLRHMAEAFGTAAERVPAALLGPGREGVHLRDTALLSRALLEPALDRWLTEQGVTIVGGAFSMNSDGSGRAVVADVEVEAAQVVLADDAALLSHLPEAQWPALLLRQPAATVLTEPTAPIAAPVMHQLDTGMTLLQEAGRGIAALGPGQLDAFAQRLNVLLGEQRSVRQAGQSSYTRIATADDAPAVGRLRGSGPDILAGFGPTGAFIAPAIARWLSGVATADENAWFAARLVDRTATASPVAEFGTAA